MRGAWAIGLVLCLLAWQSLGLLHTVRHAHGGAAQAAAAGDAHAGHDASHDLFDDHPEGGPECRLLNQLALGDLGTATHPRLVLLAPVQAAARAGAPAPPALGAVAPRSRGPPPKALTALS